LLWSVTSCPSFSFSIHGTAYRVTYFYSTSYSAAKKRQTDIPSLQIIDTSE